jgi:hypothetical protein
MMFLNVSVHFYFNFILKIISTELAKIHLVLLIYIFDF